LTDDGQGKAALPSSCKRNLRAFVKKHPSLDAVIEAMARSDAVELAMQEHDEQRWDAEELTIEHNTNWHTWPEDDVDYEGVPKLYQDDDGAVSEANQEDDRVAPEVGQDDDWVQLDVNEDDDWVHVDQLLAGEMEELDISSDISKSSESSDDIKATD
jgi:hypothetical protein